MRQNKNLHRQAWDFGVVRYQRQPQTQIFLGKVNRCVVQPKSVAVNAMSGNVRMDIFPFPGSGSATLPPSQQKSGYHRRRRKSRAWFAYLGCVWWGRAWVHRWRRSSSVRVQHTVGSRNGLSAKLRREVGRLYGERRFGILELVPLAIMEPHWQFIPENGTGSSTIRNTDVHALRHSRVSSPP